MLSQNDKDAYDMTNADEMTKDAFSEVVSARLTRLLEDQQEIEDWIDAQGGWR